MLFSKKIIGSLNRPKTSAAEAEGRLLKSFGIGRLCSASVIVCSYDTYTFENLIVILRNLLGAFKYLKSLHFAWIASEDERFGSQKIQDCYNFIKENFPLKAKVIIAEYESYERYEEDVLTNLINKGEGKPPKIVAPGSINN